MNKYLFLFFCLYSASLFAQKAANDYNHHGHTLHLVEFTDKIGTPYSVFNPEEFLSAKAIDRRERMGIAIDEDDLPITPSYISEVLSKGVEFHNKSKWLNALAIHTGDTNKLKEIALLPFVKSVKPLGKFRNVRKPNPSSRIPKVNTNRHVDSYYGHGLNQIKMLGGDALHDLGYTGKGVHVAVFDGGFKYVYRMPVFDSMRHHDRLLGTHDFVEGDNYVYEASSHGTNVLSTMASKSPHLLVGTAPDASYYLFKTEDVKGEFRTEEINWVAAIERADSVGVDVINSSLGYTAFNDTTMSYDYEDMNGKTAYISRGAQIGTEKGILVVNSAGNEGGGKWHYIGAPADAPGVLSIAAVRGDGKRAGFSSWGPTSDGRTKPDIAAQGLGTVVADMYKYKVGRSSGTSFSSPVMAGMVASLKQAFPNKTAEEIKTAIKRSANQANNPDESLGYGIPNYLVAYLFLSEACIVIDPQGSLFSTFSTVKDELSFVIEQKEETAVEIIIQDKLGHTKYQFDEKVAGGKVHEIKIDLSDFPDDVYTFLLAINDIYLPLPLVKH